MGGTEADQRQSGDEHAFIAEIVHHLSQPLTALQCSLELSLFRDQTIDELRGSVEAALQNAECLRQRLRLLRELNQADDPGDLSQPTDLPGLLRDLREELLPLFESAGQKFQLQVDRGPLPVRGNKAKLMRALFYFLEYLFRYSARGTTLAVRVCPGKGGQAEISITASSCLPLGSAVENESGPQCSCEIEIARRSFRALGGNFAEVSSASAQSVWTATLPLAG